MYLRGGWHPTAFGFLARDNAQMVASRLHPARGGLAPIGWLDLAISCSTPRASWLLGYVVLLSPTANSDERKVVSLTARSNSGSVDAYTHLSLCLTEDAKGVELDRVHEIFDVDGTSCGLRRAAIHRLYFM